MAKSTHPTKPCADGFCFLAGLFFGLFCFWSLTLYHYKPHFGFIPLSAKASGYGAEAPILHSDPPHETFYDDPELSYFIEKPVNNWDQKRRVWLDLHPSFAAGSRDRVLLVTGSQPSVCKNPIGDHLLLRFFKNKVDYCRLHGHDIFYNDAYLHPKMDSYWAKLPIIRAAMLAHPEAEWIWWMDSDAVFTDMEFKVPLGRYKDHNLVVHGWPNMVYEDKNKSWTGLNAGVLLIRNCQWSMDLIDVWASMGPLSPDFERWGQILTSVFKDKLFPVSDDQSSLIYLLFTNKEKWGDNTYLEGEYNLEGYWLALVGKYDILTESYIKMERNEGVLRRRHAEKVNEWYDTEREKYLKRRERRPFVTHFTGCQPCSGEHNPQYSADLCWNEMKRALNYADNQVLKNYGFVHPELSSSDVSAVRS
ncbi:glycosyltransferase 6-like [Prunus yedoensis var. nudiflora]|uniref:Glycosyltransferase 6-like n=1 Tax=Prunus yedoensis var. nudiflora TaxID=2094558 RepID=A0A314YUX3_PRUYE|nr:glycosyltransferase 6-like [Prunus yedoensis var. nudiflora]